MVRNMSNNLHNFLIDRGMSARTALLCVVLSVSACSQMPVQQQESETIDVEPQKQVEVSAAESPEETAIEKAKPARPKIELTDEILYKLLLAEFAGHRDQLDISVKNYLELARSTRDPEVVERATRISVYARDNAAAREAASLWVELDPDNIDAHQVLAVMAVREGNIELALDHLNILLDNSSGKIDQKLWMIANLLGREDADKEKQQQIILNVMERLMASRQDDANALFAYSHVLARLGNLDKAKELLEKVLVLMPDNNNVALSYVSLLQRQDKELEAIDWLEKNLVNQDENFNLRLIYARLLADTKQFDAARREFELLAAQAPNNSDVLYALGLLYLQASRMDESEQYFMRLSNTKQHVDEANYYLGRIAEERNDLEKAGSWYQGVQKGENYFDAQIRMSLILSRQDRVEDARTHLHSVRARSAREKSMLIQAEGEILTGEERYEDAMSVYDKALEENYNADILYSRAMLAEKMDRLDILEQDLKQIIENEPDNAQALNALGYTLADRTDRYDEAYNYIKRALDVSPNDFYILDSMGWVLYRLGRLDESVEYLRRALELRPDPEIAAHLGEVLWVMGDKERAREVWETARQQTPDDTRLLDVINRFSN